ncbi:MAG: hypothetical protein KGL39_00160 [Patescibacteria group bacterium]|nr:hypothetical protein [Patescibacteria group bacterium]
MANEIQLSGPGSGRTLYALIRGGSISPGLIWQTTTNTFVNYATASLANYTISLTEQGTASNFYAGNFPTAIAPGTYSVIAKQQLGGSAAETDPTVGNGNVEWNGTGLAPLSDTATSGLVGQFLPLRLFRGQMIQNMPIFLKSSADHTTPFTSGVLSGQISRDGAAFGVLQSGKFTEIGLGFYSLQALTSGDLTANTISLAISAVGISGGNADQLSMAFILQRSSGQLG